MDKKDIQTLIQELQTKINQTKFCWVCGRENLLTEHHSIPQKVKSPLANLKIPVCENCVGVIHNGDELISLLKKIYF